MKNVRWDITGPHPQLLSFPPCWHNPLKAVGNGSSPFNQGHSLRCLSTILFKNGQFYRKEGRESTAGMYSISDWISFCATTCKQICLIRTPCFYCILSDFFNEEEEIRQWRWDLGLSQGPPGIFSRPLVTPDPRALLCIPVSAPWHLPFLFPLPQQPSK